MLLGSAVQKFAPQDNRVTEGEPVIAGHSQSEVERLAAQIHRELAKAAAEPEHLLRRNRRTRRQRARVAERHHLSEQRV